MVPPLPHHTLTRRILSLHSSSQLQRARRPSAASSGSQIRLERLPGATLQGPGWVAVGSVCHARLCCAEQPVHFRKEHLCDAHRQAVALVCGDPLHETRCGLAEERMQAAHLLEKAPPHRPLCPSPFCCQVQTTVAKLQMRWRRSKLCTMRRRCHIAAAASPACFKCAAPYPCTGCR